MPLGKGLRGVAPGLVKALRGGVAVATATGLDDGFLRGRLGRTRCGANDRFMATAAENKRKNGI